MPPRQVKVVGEVNVPGVYTIQKKEETLSEIIARAGGFSSNAFDEGLTLYRDSLQIVLKDYSISVLDSDSIFVPQHPGTITVEGAIFNPGLVQYIPGKSLKEYIESAGGFTPNAQRKTIAIHYANGDVKLKKNIWYTPPVREGSTITVYKKPASTPFDVTEFLKELASVTASLATIYYIITATN
jgi:protein involved in polysaccharide export with SLBB domain